MLMRLHHHHDDDKEFCACTGALYDPAMVSVMLLYVSLALPHASGLSAASSNSAIAEAASIWAPHGVVVRDASSGLPTTNDTIVVRVVIQRRPVAATPWRGPLGAMRFDGSGTPLAEIALYL